MKRANKIIVFVVLTMLLSSQYVYAFSTRHHVINMGKSLVEFCFSPLYGIFIQGPKNIKEMYRYEVYGSEKPEKRGILRYRLFAFWSMPGVEAMAIIDSLVDSAAAAGKFGKNFLSIFFSD